MKPEEPAEIARNLALRRLSLREHGAAEMRKYLVEHEVEGALAEELVSELVARGLIDDDRYTRVVTRGQAVRGKGPRYIQAKMARKGVRADLDRIREHYAEVAPEDELSAARRIVETRYPQAASDLKVRQRAFRALLARGFTMDIAKLAVSAPKPRET